MLCRGAALPTNTPGIPCIFDPLGRAGICGDWLLGSSLEAAAISGISLANHVSFLIYPAQCTSNFELQMQSVFPVMSY